MLEIPALAPAVLALAVLIETPERQLGWAGGTAGVLFGISLLTKLVPVMLVPVAAVVIYLRVIGRKSSSAGLSECNSAQFPLLTNWRPVTATIVMFLAAMVVTFIGLDWLIERGAFIRHFQQTWASHFGTAKSFEYGSAADYSFDWTLLLKHWDATIPALVGACVCLRAARRDLMHLLPPLWLAWSLLVFGLHRPWWSYYYVHTAIPLCWCAGIGLAFLWRKADLAGLRQRFSSSRPILANLSILAAPTLLGLYLLSAVLWAGGRAYMQVRTARNSPQIYNSLVLAEMARYKPFTKWLYTDEPIYSFHSGIPLPPDLAVVMLKRFWSGEMTNARLAREVKEYAPGLILLGTRVSRTPLDELLHSEYRLVYFDTDHRLYAHKSISNKPPL